MSPTMIRWVVRERVLWLYLEIVRLLAGLFGRRITAVNPYAREFDL